MRADLDAGVRGHPGVNEHTDHKPRNALPGGLAEELARTHNHKIYDICICMYIYIYIYTHIYVFMYIYNTLYERE